MVEIATSILTVPKDKIIKTIYNLETAKTDYFHIDVMDGLFVESFTNEIMEEYCKYIKSYRSNKKWKTSYRINKLYKIK